MNEDFYALCREPDPLLSSNVFQQLAEQPSPDALTGSGLPHFGFQDPHIEASQILQALAAGEEQGVGGVT